MIRAVLTLVVAMAVAAAIVIFGPSLAEMLLPAIGIDGEDYPAMETVFVLVIFGAMLAVGVAGGVIAREPPLAMGGSAGVAVPLGLTIGLGGVGLATAYAWVADTLAPAGGGTGSGALVLWGAAVIALQVLAEEVYFRGWLQPVLVRAWGSIIGILLSSAAFAALHVMGGARAPVTLVNLLLGGLMFGVLAWRFGGIAGAVTAHFGWNASEQLLLGLDPNPGVGSFGALLDLELAGSALWGGSSEGLNASLAMSFALAAILVPLLIVVRGGAREPEVKPAAVRG